MKPGMRVLIKEVIHEDGVSPAQIGTVLDDLDDVVYIRLDEFIQVGGQLVRQYDDPEDECQEFGREFVIQIKEEES